jgi:hypothetical protein
MMSLDLSIDKSVKKSLDSICPKIVANPSFLNDYGLTGFKKKYQCTKLVYIDMFKKNIML